MSASATNNINLNKHIKFNKNKICSYNRLWKLKIYTIIQTLLIYLLSLHPLCGGDLLF